MVECEDGFEWLPQCSGAALLLSTARLDIFYWDVVWGLFAHATLSLNAG